MKALVTGGSGFIGGHIVQAFERRGHNVTIVSLHQPAYYTKADFVQLDIRQIALAVQLDPADYDVVCHAAGELGTHTTYSRVSKTFDVNVQGMISLLEWLKGADTKVINCGVIREWNNPYITSKQTAAKIGQMYREAFGVKFLDIGMTVVYGPRQGWKEEKVVPRFVIKALLGEQLPIFGDGSSMMNIMYAKDVADIFVELAAKDEVFNEVGRIQLANPKGDISVHDFAYKLIGLIRNEYLIETCNRMSFVDMRPGQPGNVGVTYNLDAARKYIESLDERFTPLEKGLRHTIDWYKGVV